MVVLNGHIGKLERKMNIETITETHKGEDIGIRGKPIEKTEDSIIFRYIRDNRWVDWIPYVGLITIVKYEKNPVQRLLKSAWQGACILGAVGEYRI